MNPTALPVNIIALRSFLFVQAVLASTYLPTVDGDDCLKVGLQCFIGRRIFNEYGNNGIDQFCSQTN
jgi:hypothetical protein